MKNIVGNSAKINESDIGMLAYQMWEKAGSPHGQDWQFWFEAETKLRALAKAAPATATATSSPVEPRKTTMPKAAQVEPGLTHPNSSRMQQKAVRA
ncbi:MAG: hypothetical protein QOJ40_2087 [Verrucomicrobiota bacterium]